MSKDLQPLLNPRSVAVIGATPDTARPGGRALQYLQRYGFPGSIYPVNPKRDEVAGLACVPSVAALENPPDMAIVSVPAAGVCDVVRECQAAGVRALTIYTSGFAEAGEGGAAHEHELRDLIETGGTVVCGPNSQGIANFLDNMVAYFTSELGADDVPAGPVGFASHSGVMGGIVARECIERGIGAGYLLSLGNEAGVDLADAIAFMAADPRIRVVGAYVEGVRDAGEMRAAIEGARARGVAVVLLKGGRGEAAVKAAASHTAALAGDWATHAAAFRQWGAVVVEDLESLFDAIELFALTGARPAGPGVGVITNSGGIGVLCADAVTSRGLEVPALSSAVEAAVGEGLPGFASAKNPVDIALQLLNEPESLGRFVTTVAGDAGVDIVMPFVGVTRYKVETVIAELGRAAAATDKPVIAGWLGGDPAGPPQLRAQGIPVAPTPERAGRMARLLVDQARPTVVSAAASDMPDISAAVDAARYFTGRNGPLGEREGVAILAAGGIRVPAGGHAVDAEAAGRMADEIGGPVALKISAPDIAHKTEVGGVTLGLEGGAAVRAEAAQMQARVMSAVADADVDGFLVQGLVGRGVELIVGMRRDAAFGPVVAIGLGGTLVEVMRDRALAVPPFGRAYVADLLRGLKGYPLLEGVRGAAPADIDAIVDAVMKVAALAVAVPEISEIDINPLIVGPEGAVAADALFVMNASSPAP